VSSSSAERALQAVRTFQSESERGFICDGEFIR